MMGSIISSSEARSARYESLRGRQGDHITQTFIGEIIMADKTLTAFARAAIRINRLPLVSAITSAIAMSSAFIFGALLSLGFKFLPLINKHELAVNIIFSLVIPLSIVFAVLRNIVYFLLESARE